MLKGTRVPMEFKEGTTWQPFLPPVDSLAYDELRLLTVQSMASMYEEQKMILDKIQEQDGTDIFVATYDAVGREADGHVYSWCSWAQDVDSLLPETHLVALTDPQSPAGKMLGFAKWEQLISVAGDLMESCDNLYPVRYRVKGFPSREQLARLELIEI